MTRRLKWLVSVFLNLDSEPTQITLLYWLVYTVSLV
jgi:hypothetical protein